MCFHMYGLYMSPIGSHAFHISYVKNCIDRYMCIVTYVSTYMSTYRVGQKNWTCLSVDNSALVSGRNTCDASKVSECCKE